MEKATKVLLQIRKLASNKNIDINYRRNIIKATVVPIALYGSEAWKLNDSTTIKQLHQLSRSIKRIISEDPNNFRIILDYDDINLMTLWYVENTTIKV